MLTIKDTPQNLHLGLLKSVIAPKYTLLCSNFAKEVSMNMHAIHRLYFISKYFVLGTEDFPLFSLAYLKASNSVPKYWTLSKVGQ